MIGRYSPGSSIAISGLLVLLRLGTSSSFVPIVVPCFGGTNSRAACSPPYPSSPIPCRMMSTSKSADNSESDDSSSSSELNMNSLQQRMSRQQEQYANLVLEQSKYADAEQPIPETVHIILFHPGTDKQHVHSIEFPKSSGNNLILAFENEGECVGFATMLQELEFVDPSPEETVFEPFRQYCEMAGLSLMIVPKGFELTPPQINANDDDDDNDTNNEDELIDGIEEVSIEGVVHDDGDLDAWG